MINADDVYPDFPETMGEEGAIRFTKQGREYRLYRAGSDLWFIHMSDTPREDFELVITGMSRNRRNFDVEGRGHLGSLTGIGATPGILFGKLF